ncbi:unnamed protein product [Didymodactylos carnosus]|uniref:Uncharacterized protein n=1 Tax=Didymodactylos carnosus TaxID=1234261 RepID=A0A8S2FXY5_9BILA|nr:unnamed protein product [Didymodactylos carnosus]CAF4369713.1 unnamed protein product [Didymodactylos carnosus]
MKTLNKRINDFCYDTDSSSIDEPDDDFTDDAHNGENWDKDLNEAKLKLRLHYETDTLNQENIHNAL